MAQFYMLLCLLWLIIELYMYLHFRIWLCFVTDFGKFVTSFRNIAE